MKEIIGYFDENNFKIYIHSRTFVIIDMIDGLWLQKVIIRSMGAEKQIGYNLSSSNLGVRADAIKLYENKKNIYIYYLFVYVAKCIQCVKMYTMLRLFHRSPRCRSSNSAVKVKVLRAIKFTWPAWNVIDFEETNVFVGKCDSEIERDPPRYPISRQWRTVLSSDPIGCPLSRQSSRRNFRYACR